MIRDSRANPRTARYLLSASSFDEMLPSACAKFASPYAKVPLTVCGSFADRSRRQVAVAMVFR